MNDIATIEDGNILRNSDAFSGSPREIVETLALNKIKGFLGTIVSVAWTAPSQFSPELRLRF